VLQSEYSQRKKQINEHDYINNENHRTWKGDDSVSSESALTLRLHDYEQPASFYFLAFLSLTLYSRG
jgi:hypothetical protein